jgi:hypothetical protein
VWVGVFDRCKRVIWLCIAGNTMIYTIIGINTVVAAVVGGEYLSYSAVIPLWYWLNWNVMQVIMIARLHAMYQRSRSMLVCLVIIFLAVNISCEVIAAIVLKDTVAGKPYLLTWRTQFIGWIPEELILSGTYMCTFEYEGDVQLWTSMIWMLNVVWETLALCLSVWITVKHFRDLRRLGPSTRLTIGDCFRVLIKSHVLYFARWACNVNVVIFLCWSSARASFVSVSCLQLGLLASESMVRRPVADICV